MDRHALRNLWVHDDREIEVLTGGILKERKTIQEWPLSSVEGILLEDGRRFVYKSQYGPTVEPDFYRRARSPLMVSAQTIWESDGHSCMIFKYIDGPRVQDLHLTEDEAVCMGRELVAQISAIGGEPSSYYDIGDTDKWVRFVDSTLSDLQHLVDLGRFKCVSGETVRGLDRLARDPAILKAIRGSRGLVHGDLRGDNVFREAHGYRVIDWQRPLIGPPELDLLTVIDDCGFDSMKFVDGGIAAIKVFLTVGWLTECKTLWIPDAECYDQAIADAPRKAGACLNYRAAERRTHRNRRKSTRGLP